MRESLLDIVIRLNDLNDKDLADAVTQNDDVQWCLSELRDILGIIGDMSVDHLRELVQADHDSRCVVLPTKEHADEDGEKALKHAMLVLDVVNSGANRYTVDAIAEKLAREASGKTVEEMEGE